MKRRRGREHALKILYMADIRDENPLDLIDEYWLMNGDEEQDVKNFAEKIVKGVFENKENVDKNISSTIVNWDFNRLGVIDRNILRIGTYELLFEEKIPAVVSINEAIEIAKKYGTEDSPKFINGVLHKIKDNIKKQ
ncbi:MAG TPA: transcription antitermination factor NusB [bacterium]|nr:transcription antitermination factor NusB [bacterium]